MSGNSVFGTAASGSKLGAGVGSATTTQRATSTRSPSPRNVLRIEPHEPIPAPTGYRIDCSVTGAPEGVPTRLWFEVDAPDCQVVPPETADFAACAMLPMAMSTGLRLEVDGSVHIELVRNLLEYEDAWTMWRDDLFSLVPIEPTDVLQAQPEARPADRGTVLAFSGGLDGAHSLIAHMSGLLGPRSYPISLAVMVHGFDIPLRHARTFDRAAANARRQLDTFDVPLVTVRTNWRAFQVEWAMTYAAGLASVLHLFDGCASRAVVSADFPYAHMVRKWGANPVTNPLLGSPEFSIITSGQGTERTTKSLEVSRYPAIRDRLRVCWEGEALDRNCGRCKKCVLTQMCFLAGGVGVPECLGEPDAALIRAYQVDNFLQASRLDLLTAGRAGFPPPLRDALDQMVAREQRRFADPDVPLDPDRPDPSALERALAESAARSDRLQRDLHAVVSSRRVRLARTLIEPIDRTRSLLGRIRGNGAT